ncbi:unnamed protein product [Tilletia laevis]|uniref:Uncharacterized protein n=1 Tax=Tilletia laevis TaxID=157183 RepID=A0A9N8QN03_9BASI|nr:unnamed protein product [Tilletia caries]CAD6902907.1 unnamed protein product [Tilletia caries]CAD6962377.1 unnamed protein product [Tilletia laevis]CAD6966414.1 unnamed protein product [Tilletia laevis]
MLNFRLSWPAALRSSPSASPISAPVHTADATAPSSKPTPTPTPTPSAREHKSKASGIPASVRYFAIFDPRPPALKSKGKGKGKGKGKERATDDDNENEEQPPSTTVLFYSSPSEPTTTQTTIQRRLGLASAIVHFSTELNQLATTTTPAPSQPPPSTTSGPSAQTPIKDMSRWSVTASKTRTLTLRVRPFVYLHVVIDLPRLPRSVPASSTATGTASKASLKGAPGAKEGKRAATVKWEYVANGVADEPVLEAMANAWNAFVERNGEPSSRDPSESSMAAPDDDDEEEEEEEKYHRALEKFFMPWVLTWDLASSSFPRPNKLSSLSNTGTIRGERNTLKVRPRK